MGENGPSKQWPDPLSTGISKGNRKQEEAGKLCERCLSMQMGLRDRSLLMVGGGAEDIEGGHL